MTKIKPGALIYFKLLTVVFIWGSLFHVAKFLVQGSDVFTVSFVRFVTSAVVLLFLCYRKYGTRAFKQDKTSWLLLFAMGVTGVFLYNLFFFGAEALIPVNQMAILFAFVPCVTVFLGTIFLKSKLNFAGYIGIFTALAGAIMVLSLSEPECGQVFCTNLFQHLVLGQILAILAVVAMASYNIFNRKASMVGLDALTITTFSSLFGALLLFVSYLHFGAPVQTLLHKSWSFWTGILYFALFATALSYHWYSEAIKVLGVGKTAVFLNGVPFSAILIGVVLGDKISVAEFMAGVMIVLGVLLTNFATSK
jgi:drug/metabolite transporter (DMT)-like permease